MEGFIAFAFMSGIVCSIISFVIYNEPLSILLGFLFGPIGVLIVAVLKNGDSGYEGRVKEADEREKRIAQTQKEIEKKRKEYNEHIKELNKEEWQKTKEAWLKFLKSIFRFLRKVFMPLEKLIKTLYNDILK